MTSAAVTGCKLERKTIGSLRGCFFVPAYQRGYRWDKGDVRRLLDDVYESKGQPYSLQPIVVKHHSHGSKSEWELIDGQQRLTTLYLILQYMKREAGAGLGAPYTLRYETRNTSETYLSSLDPQEQNNNIDFYHLYHADRAIHDWFQTWGDKFDQNAVANDMLSYLFKSVGIIWYEASPTTSATALFTRLNVGRIPLTDAELIKAALLASVRTTTSADRAQEIAAQWDNIERDLHQPDIWAFIAGLAENANDEQYPTRISLLLDTLADEKSDRSSSTSKRPLYYTFDQLRTDVDKSPTEFWSRVIALHAQILGWFAQPKVYNKIGFLVANGTGFGVIVKQAKEMKKSEFDAYLSDFIRKSINVTKNKIDDLRYDERKGYLKLVQLLLLMNVETISKTQQHFPFARHLKENWSLEHIHAQNAESLNRAAQWRSWLNEHHTALEVVKSDEVDVDVIRNEIVVAIGKIDNGTFLRRDFDHLSERVAKLLSDSKLGGDSIHSIRNMALLSSEQNSGLSNAVFEVKRRKILERDRKGEYVPICTRNVFLKYYANADALQPHFWSDKDRDSYIEAIHEALNAYYSADKHEKV